METLEKEPWDMRLLVTTNYLPKLAKDGMLLGKSFDEWIDMNAVDFYQTLASSYSEFEFEEKITEDKEYKILYFQVENTRITFAYQMAIKGEINGWSGDKGMHPVFSEKITGYSDWFVMDIVYAINPWEETLGRNQKRIEKARQEFNKNQ